MLKVRISQKDSKSDVGAAPTNRYGEGWLPSADDDKPAWQQRYDKDPGEGARPMSKPILENGCVAFGADVSQRYDQTQRPSNMAKTLQDIASAETIDVAVATSIAKEQGIHSEAEYERKLVAPEHVRPASDQEVVSQLAVAACPVRVSCIYSRPSRATVFR